LDPPNLPDRMVTAQEVAVEAQLSSGVFLCGTDLLPVFGQNFGVAGVFEFAWDRVEGAKTYLLTIGGSPLQAALLRRSSRWILPMIPTNVWFATRGHWVVPLLPHTNQPAAFTSTR
jgi:hypothetical protein